MDKPVPIIPIRDGIVFPNTESVLTFGRPKSLAALELSFSQERIVCFVLQKNARLNDPGPSDIFTTGTLCRIERMIKTDGEINAQVRGLSRMKIKSENTPSQLADLVASVLDIKPIQKQELLETIDVKERLEKIAEYLSKELKVLELEKKIATKTQERFEKGAREVMLRERLKTIEKELGESDEDQEIRELLMKIKEAKMPVDIEEKARKEVKKLAQMTQFNPEAGYIRNYLEWLIDLPWSKESENNVDIKSAEKILNDDHFGLKDAKERITEYLAVHKLAGKMKGPILCFVGPPGVGKT